jgi:hypothetical protein
MEVNMIKNSLRSFLLLILLAAVPATVLAQDARSLLSNGSKALGADGLKTLQYSGSGSSYVVAPGPVPNGGWPHGVMKSYVRDLNLDTATSRVQLVRAHGAPPAEEALSFAIDPNSPWSTQFDYWITPYGFLKGAMAHNATVESRNVFGAPFRVVTFTLSGNHRVVGYFNDKDVIEKVETWIGDKGDVLVEAYYRDYTDFSGVKVPTMITQKQAGALSMILIVKEAKAGK